jgi:hypothetical protein
LPACGTDQNLNPQLIIPMTGGSPVIGIPLGGNIFEPVTGGAPVIGIPTSPYRKFSNIWQLSG